jgi:hypothetical protein
MNTDKHGIINILGDLTNIKTHYMRDNSALYAFLGGKLSVWVDKVCCLS